MRNLPKLAKEGFIQDPKTSKEFSEIPFDNLEIIKNHISLNYKKIKTIKRSVTSYGLKHRIEDDLGFYVSNGECIKAFIDLGYEVQPIRINAYFNVSEKLKKSQKK